MLEMMGAGEVMSYSPVRYPFFMAFTLNPVKKFPKYFYEKGGKELNPLEYCF